jgi:hypothetical protein
MGDGSDGEADQRRIQLRPSSGSSAQGRIRWTGQGAQERPRVASIFSSTCCTEKLAAF